MSDNYRLITSELFSSQTKYIYFQLAAAGAAIAISINQSLDDPISYFHVFWLIAVSLWAGSVFCGMWAIENRNTTLAYGVEIMKIELGQHEAFQKVTDKTKATYLEYLKARDKTNAALERYSKWQTYALIFGGLFYIAWHISNMIMLRLTA